MSLELIEDLLAAVQDRFISEIDERSQSVRAALPPDAVPLLDQLEELHREAAREMARVAMAAGVSMGRGLAEWGPPPRGSS